MMQTNEMTAAILKKCGVIEIEQIKIPEPEAHEVLIKIMAVGVCGSDVHYYTDGKIGDFVVEKPLILGHECAGIIVKVGEKVTKAKIGDRVAIEAGIPCHHCSYCREGKYNLCPDVSFMATPPIDGAFTQYVAHHEDYVAQLDDEMTYEIGMMLEPFSVGLYACQQADIKPGDSIAIFGMGTIGLLGILAARTYGATNIIAIDSEENRLDFARRLGANHVINLRDEDPVARIKELTADQGVDIAFEMAGHENALKNAVACVKRGGTICAVGFPTNHVPLDISLLVLNELKLCGTFRYSHTYPRGLDLLKQYKLEIEELITGKYLLEDTKEALEQAIINKQKHVKIVVYPNSF